MPRHRPDNLLRNRTEDLIVNSAARIGPLETAKVFEIPVSRVYRTCADINIFLAHLDRQLDEELEWMKKEAEFLPKLLAFYKHKT